MKIRTRLTIWYLAITLTVALIFGLGTYWAMHRLLLRALDEELEIFCDAIERSYDPFFSEFVELVLDPAKPNPYLEYYLIVCDAAGDTLFSSPMVKQIPLNIAFTGNVTKNSHTVHLHIDNAIPFLHPDENGEVTFRIFSRELFYQDRPVGWIVAGLHIEDIEASLETLLEVLLIAMVFIVLLFGFGSYLLTGQALRPVDQITRKADQISYSNLNERIRVYNEEDELANLSRVLNILLERLQKAFESQQRFLGDAAHELKTPMSVLRAHWEREVNNPELSMDMKEKIVKDIEKISHLGHLINNLLLLSQTESIHSNFEFKTLRLDILLQEVLTDIKILSDNKSQVLKTEDMPEATIRGDKDSLFQLFFNLLDNAVKYTPEEGNIFLRLHLEEGWSIVEIRDSGPGIPAKDLPHIFDRFYRVKKDRSRKTGGSGLGLAICKLIAESHQGNIDVDSEPGRGSTFQVKLPLDAS